MSGDRRTRRRFLADLLFAGGALTAASALGYVATRDNVPAQPPAALDPPAAVETPCALGTPGNPPPTKNEPCLGENCEVRPSGSLTIGEFPVPEPVQAPKKKPWRDPMAPPVRRPEPQLAGRMIPARPRP